MKTFNEDGFDNEIKSIMKQSLIFLISVIIELLSVVALRLYRSGLKSSCVDVEHEEAGCDMNSKENFGLRMTWSLLDSLSKFTYCMYFLWVQH